MKKISLLIITLSIYITSYSYALEVATHKAINAYIAQNTINSFSLDSYLKNQLGISGGIKESFTSSNTSYEAWQWLREGGLYEDIPYWYMPYLRSVNHFHNPITKQGFSGIWGTGILSGESSLLWAQKPKNTQSPGGYYSWHDVRDYFYRALTSADKNIRDTSFAQTFRGLGQLMHLVQDLSVPAHARNDGHGPCWLSYNYECWVEAHPEIISASTPIFFDLSVLGLLNPLASVPIANLFDTNKYTGTNPEITISKNIGLSEYTNANFVSDDTIFTENFPYPRYSPEAYEMYEIDIPPNKKRIYLRKKGDGETIEHFATAGPLYKYLSFDPVLQRDELKLDREVHRDYAEKLIPRAVGYSAGLLNYFFRGDINMISDGATGSGYVIENKSDEAMEGTFELWYDDTNDNRKMIWSGYLSIDPSSKSTNITFSPPVDTEPCKYILVFKGIMGNETEAVVANANANPVNNCSPLTIINEDGTPATDTVLRGGHNNYKATGCCGKVIWSISGVGGHISQGGVLSVSKVACGTLTITTECEACETSATQSVRVPDDCLALTIVNEDGSPATDTILRGGSNDYKVLGDCKGKVNWSVGVEAGSTLGGSTITQAGVLTAGSTSCGSLKVTATCSAYGTSVTHGVRVTNAGQWVLLTHEVYCNDGFLNYSSVCYEGNMRVTRYYGTRSHWGWDPNAWPGSCPIICEAGVECSNVYNVDYYGNCEGTFWNWYSRIWKGITVIEEWQCQ